MRVIYENIKQKLAKYIKSQYNANSKVKLVGEPFKIYEIILKNYKDNIQINDDILQFIFLNDTFKIKKYFRFYLNNEWFVHLDKFIKYIISLYKSKINNVVK